MTNIEQPIAQQKYGQLIRDQQKLDELISDLHEQLRLDQRRLDQLILKQQSLLQQIQEQRLELPTSNSFDWLERKKKKEADRIDKCAAMINIAALHNRENLLNDTRLACNKTMIHNGRRLNVTGHVFDTCYFCNMGESCYKNCADSRDPLIGTRPCYYIDKWGTEEAQECKSSHGQWIMATNEYGLTYRVLLPHMFTLMEPQFQKCDRSCMSPCYKCALASGTFQFSAAKAAASADSTV
jgi:hypothetical protein